MENKIIAKKSQEFIRHFGEMGSKWGINRTVGQIYALLYLSKKPLNAEEIAKELKLSRSNVGIGLKEIEAMNIVKISHISGQKSVYYSSLEDIFEIVKNLIEYRKNQEINPTLTMLRNLLIDTTPKQARSHEIKRMKEMYKIINLTNNWYDEIKEIESKKLLNLFEMGKKIVKIFEFFSIKNKK